MALRHLYPGTEKGLIPKEQLSVVARMRPPKVVEFRRGCDMSEVVADMKSSQTVHLDAAVGAGKSTVFPHVYARVARSLVFHLVPNPMLALDLYNRAVSTADVRGDTPVDHIVDVTQSIPRTGVVYMSCAMFVAKLLHDGCKLNSYGDVTVFLDEAHESDAYTHCVRTLAIELGAMRLILASATLSPKGARPRETPAQLVEKTFSSDLSPGNWNIMDPKMPWFYAAISNNCLIFLDSNSQAERLVSAYRRVGFEAFRLQRDMGVDRFLSAMKALRDKKGPLVVLVADYTFRSGFTFDVDLVIDSGSVSYYDSKPGEAKRMNRQIYAGEAVQAAGRAGRLRSGTVEYWRPKFDPKRMVCDLEAVEAEAAAYLYRCLGFKPGAELESAIMARANLPSDARLPDVLNTYYPLTFYVIDESGNIRRDACVKPVVQTAVSAVGSGSGSSRSSRADTLVEDTAARAKSAADVIGGFKDVNPPDYNDTSPFRDLDVSKLLASPVIEELIVGKFYLVPGVTVSGKPTIQFPEGITSVKRFVAGLHGSMSASGLAKSVRKDAIGLVLARYNLINVETAAIEEFVKGLQVSGASSLQGRVREYVVGVLEELNLLNAESKELISCLQILVHGQHTVTTIAAFDELIRERLGERQSRYDKLMVRQQFDSAGAISDAHRAVRTCALESASETQSMSRPRHITDVPSRDDQVSHYRERITSRTTTYYGVRPPETKRVYMTCGWRERLHGYKPGYIEYRTQE